MILLSSFPYVQQIVLHLNILLVGINNRVTCRDEMTSPAAGIDDV